MTNSMQERFTQQFGKDQYGGKEPFRQDKVLPFIQQEIAIALTEERERISKIAEQFLNAWGDEIYPADKFIEQINSLEK